VRAPWPTYERQNGAVERSVKCWGLGAEAGIGRFGGFGIALRTVGTAWIAPVDPLEVTVRWTGTPEGQGDAIQAASPLT
jgi:hypothetical protein